VGMRRYMTQAEVIDTGGVGSQGGRRGGVVAGGAWGCGACGGLVGGGGRVRVAWRSRRGRVGQRFKGADSGEFASRDLVDDRGGRKSD